MDNSDMDSDDRRTYLRIYKGRYLVEAGTIVSCFNYFYCLIARIPPFVLLRYPHSIVIFFHWYVRITFP